MAAMEWCFARSHELLSWGSGGGDGYNIRSKPISSCRERSRPIGFCKRTYQPWEIFKACLRPPRPLTFTSSWSSFFSSSHVSPPSNLRVKDKIDGHQADG
jgi:hypothetical protein